MYHSSRYRKLFHLWSVLGTSRETLCCRLQRGFRRYYHSHLAVLLLGRPPWCRLLLQRLWRLWRRYVSLLPRRNLHSSSYDLRCRSDPSRTRYRDSCLLDRTECPKGRGGRRDLQQYYRPVVFVRLAVIRLAFSGKLHRPSRPWLLPP